VILHPLIPGASIGFVHRLYVDDRQASFVEEIDQFVRPSDQGLYGCEFLWRPNLQEPSLQIDH